MRVYGKAGEPTVILLHKMVWSSMEFSKAQPVLARMGVRTIAVDLPGYGLSDPPPAEPSAEQYADALVPVLDHFKLARADILGTDTGAAVAVAFDVRHPDRVDRLILEGPPLFDAAKLAELLQETEVDRTPTHDGSEFGRRVQSLAASIPPHSLSDEAMHTGAMQFFLAEPRYLDGHHAAFKYDIADGLKRVTAPTLVISFPGKASISSLPMVRALRPDFDYQSIDFDGMMADFDDPEPWSALIAGFVKSGSPA